MLTLAIESSTTSVGCALGDDDGPIIVHEVRRGRRHAELLAPAIEFLCAQAEVEIGAIGSVVADVGPGLFTGLRVGLATARMLAQMLGTEMVAVSSLDVLAAAACDGERTTVSVIDARRNEVFVNLYRPVRTGGNEPESLGAPRCMSPTDLVAELRARGEVLTLAGDGAVRYFDVIAAEVPGVFPPTVTFPPVATLLALGAARALRGLSVHHEAARPLYLREPDAQISWATRTGRHTEPAS